MKIVNFEMIRENYGGKSLNHVGGKNSSLGNMITDLQDLNIRVPSGFAITTQFYYDLIEKNNIIELIEKLDETDDIDIISSKIKQIRH